MECGEEWEGWWVGCARWGGMAWGTVGEDGTGWDAVEKGVVGRGTVSFGTDEASVGPTAYLRGEVWVQHAMGWEL